MPQIGRRPSFREQRLVAIDIRVAGRQQLVAVEHRIGTGEEAERLHLVAHRLAAGGETHERGRHRDAGRRDGAHELEVVDALDACHRRTRDGDEVVDRHRLRRRRQVRQLGDQCGAVAARLPMPMMPPEQTLMPALRTSPMVSMRSCCECVVITLA